MTRRYYLACLQFNSYLITNLGNLSKIKNARFVLHVFTSRCVHLSIHESAYVCVYVCVRISFNDASR